MKQIVFCIGFVLMFVFEMSAQQPWPGRFNDFSLQGNPWNNGWNNGRNNGWNNSNFINNNFTFPYSYGYNGFFYNNNGVNLVINTPWGGGSLSFPVGTIRQNDVYTYKYPAPSPARTKKNRRGYASIDYNNPDIAMNQTWAPPQKNECVEIQYIEKQLRWVYKSVLVSYTKYTGHDQYGNVHNKTETIERMELVLE